MIDEPTAVPLASHPLGYDPVTGLHSHPVPVWARALVVVYALALAVAYAVVVREMSVTSRIVLEQRRQAYAACTTSRDTSSNNATFYGALLGRLGPDADPVFREQLARQVQTSTKNADRVCTF